jgi:septal ring factor EnvC (AmiA/AmiB activator)
MKKVDFLIHLGIKNRLFNFRLPVWVCYLIGAGFLISLPLMLYLVGKQGKELVDRGRLAALEAENSILRRKMNGVVSELDTLKKRMEEITELDTKLRVLTGLDLIHPDLRSPGLGGAQDSLLIELKSLEAYSYQAAQKIDNRLDRLLAEARLQKESYKEIRDWLERQTHLRDHTPSIWPCQGWFVSGFGYRIDPFTRKLKMHEGIDIGGPVGTPIVATADGRVKSAGPRMGYGLTVEIDHGYGYSTIYAHCHLLEVKAGDLVRRGDGIALLGSTGRSTGPHLHYEVRVSGIPVNPLQYIITKLAVLD